MRTWSKVLHYRIWICFPFGVYLFESQNDKDDGRGGEKVLHRLIHSRSAHNSTSWARLKPGVREFLGVSHWQWQKSKYLVILAFWVTLAGSWFGSGLAGTWTNILIENVSLQTCSLTCYAARSTSATGIKHCGTQHQPCGSLLIEGLCLPTMVSVLVDGLREKWGCFETQCS